eukprot:SAG22_NODE_1446_length_4405_cov_1.853460_2_plen_141_part_00
MTGELQWAPGGGGAGSLCIKLHEDPGWNCANTDANRTAVFNGHCSSAGGAHKTNYFFLAPASPAAAGGGGHGGPRDVQTMHIKSHDCPELCLAKLWDNDINGDAGGDGLGGGPTPAMRVALASCANANRSSIAWVRELVE